MGKHRARQAALQAQRVDRRLRELRDGVRPLRFEGALSPDGVTLARARGH